MDQRLIGRRGLLAGGVAATIGGMTAAPVFAQDRFGRMSLSVRINDNGPYVFALDSAASMSLIVSDLAETLALPSAGTVGMHTLLGREVTPTVRIGHVSSGALDGRNVRMAVGSRAALAGMDGLISPGLLNRRRVMLNFRGDQILIGRGRTRDQSLFDPERRVKFTSPAGATFRSLVVLDAAVDGHPVKAIVDTGSLSTIANTALADAVQARAVVMPDGTRTRPVQSATGQTAEARTMLLHGLHFGPVSLTQVPVLVGDFHAFNVWGFADTPALLLGVDVLGALRRMVIDYGRRDVTFEV